MLQAALADRFRLKPHQETKRTSIYELMVTKGGAKIRFSADQNSPDDTSPSQPGDDPKHGAMLIGNGLLIGNAVTLARFPTAISRATGAGGQRQDQP